MQPSFKYLLVDFVITAVEAESFEVCSATGDWVYKVIFYSKLSLKISDVS